ncbi:MAG: CHRD domain-containing protein, partial [Bacteriovoracaceae bacterium]
LKSPNDPRSEWRLLATFDWMNEVTQIVQEDIDPSSGRIALIVKHHGSNSGIVRYIQLTYDSIRNAPFVNGQQYHFAFAAYAAAGDGKSLFRSIESEPQIVTVVPHQPNPETHLPYAFKDSLLNVGENIVGNNDARLGLRILDPYSITGGLYDIWYGMAGASSTWTVVKNKPGTEYATISTMLTASELIAPRPNPLPTTTGTAEFTLNDARDRIAYSVNVATDNTITSIEFYSGQINTIGILVKKITTNSKTVSGVWTMNDATDPFTSQMLKDFVAGYLFVLVRTVKYPKGEMRGQLTNGMIPRATLPIADYSTSDRSVMTFQENRFPNEGFSLFVSPAPIGFRSGTQIAPSTGNVINQANKERTYSLIGPGYLWGASRYHESVIEFRFAGDTNWAISTAKIPAETKFIRVPFQVFKDSVRIVPVIENTFATDSLWNVDGNSFLNGQPLFDKIVGLVDTVDFVNNDISYNTVFANGTFPSSNSMKGRLINGVNHIARNIQFVNVNGGGVPPAVGTVIRLMPYKTIKPGDIKRVTVQSIQEGSTAVAQKKISSINVFPNPYYGVNIFEKGIQNKYVTFSHLPRKAVIKVFNLAGISVRTIVKDTPEQFITWDLKNHSGNFVSSGIYLVYIEMENIGTTVLKLAVIMEQQQINNY